MKPPIWNLCLTASSYPRNFSDSASLNLKSWMKCVEKVFRYYNHIFPKALVASDENVHSFWLALTESRLFSRQLSDGFLSAFSHQPKKSRFPWEKVKAPSLDLKILQVFFKNRGEILVFEKMLNFLSFLVLLYVSGHFKQKFFLSKFFRLIEKFHHQFK